MASNKPKPPEPPAPASAHSRAAALGQSIREGFRAVRQTRVLSKAIRELTDRTTEHEAALDEAYRALARKAEEAGIGEDLPVAKVVGHLVTELEECRSDLQQADARLKRTRQSLDVERKTNEQTLATVAGEHEKLAADLASLEAKAEAIRNRRVSSEKSIRKLEREIDRTEEGKAVSAPPDDLQGQIERFRESIAGVDAELGELQREIDPARRAAEAGAAELSEGKAAWAARRKDLESAVGACEVAASRASGRLDALQAEMARARAAVGRAIADSHSGSKELAPELERIGDVRQDLAVVSEELGAVQSEVDRLRPARKRFMLTAGAALAVVLTIIVVALVLALPGGTPDAPRPDRTGDAAAPAPAPQPDAGTAATVPASDVAPGAVQPPVRETPDAPPEQEPAGERRLFEGTAP